MRPLELRLRDFRSYSGEHKFVFAGRRLIAIVGPTGAGKTTILDAISFSLYGRTPRIGKATSTLINQRMAEAMVGLRFEANGTEWEATRIIRREGTNEHALYRYSTNSLDSEKWVMKGPVDQKIQDLLGMDFDVFTRSVLLAQGEFAEFLEAGPAGKSTVLKALFSYEKLDEMQKAAKQRSDDAKNAIAILGVRLDSIERAKTRCAELGGNLQSAQSRYQQLQSIYPEFQELNERIQNFHQMMATDRKQRDNIKDLRLPAQKKSEKVILDAEQAVSRIKEAEVGVEDADRKAAAAEEVIQSPEFQERLERFQEANRMVDRLSGLRGAVSRAQKRSVEAGQQHERSANRLEQFRRELTTAEERLLQAMEADQAAEHVLELAMESLEDARHRDMAAELRSNLEKGGDCPVCRQPVHDVPDAVVDSGKKKAEKECKKAKSARRETAANLSVATATREGAAARVESAEENLESDGRQAKADNQALAESQQELDKCLADLENILGPGDPLPLLEEEKNAIQAIQIKDKQSRDALKKARDALSKTRSAEEGAQQALGDLWTKLAGLATQLGTKASGAGNDTQATQQLWAHLHEERARKISELESQLQAQQKNLEETNAGLEVLRVKYEVQKSVGEELAAVETSIKLLSQELEKAEEQAAAEKKVVEEKKSEQVKRDNFARLAEDLTNSKFIGFLLDVVKMTLSEIGSTHFQQLSSGRYRFSEDGKFDVIDMNFAEQTRQSDSLSGGETFLASLGLARALAEMVGREGGRLDAFMLDEGFGTLDPEHLDLAMEGVERLVADSDRRLVMVVSHVAELRERVDDLLILEKAPATGDTQIVQGAGAS